MNLYGINNARITKGARMFTTGFERPYTKFPMETSYRKRYTIPYTTEFAQHLKFGKWSDWLGIPFVFLPVRNTEGKWVWGCGVYAQYKVHGVSFEGSVIDAEVKFDRKKDIFIRKLQGGANV